MTTTNNPENQNSKPHGLGDQVQIIANQDSKTGTRELIEKQLDAMEGANLTATIKAFQGASRGSYFVTIGNSSEWNEVSIRLFDSPRGKAIATGYIDKGHTSHERFTAAEELRGLVRAYLCR